MGILRVLVDRIIFLFTGEYLMSMSIENGVLSFMENKKRPIQAIVLGTNVDVCTKKRLTLEQAEALIMHRWANPKKEKMRKIIITAKNATLSIRQVFKKLKDIWNLPSTVSKNHSDIYGYVNWLEKRVNERTTVHTDIGWKGDQTQVIVVGRYRGKDYIRAFNVRPNGLNSLIEMLKEEERYAKVGRNDMFPNIEFSAVYPYEEY